MKEYLLTVVRFDEKLLITADGNNSILEHLQKAGLALHSAHCGGKGSCRKCTVKVQGQVRPIGKAESFYCSGEVLACRFSPAGDCTVALGREAAMSIPLSSPDSIGSGEAGLGLSFDLGTTTVSAALYDLESGLCKGRLSAPNAQRGFGADVISRLEACRNGLLPQLIACTQNQLREMGKALGAEPGNLSRVSIAGNSVMEYLAAGYDPSPLAVPPFELSRRFGEVSDSDLWAGAKLSLGRCISAYVGGDISAGMLSCGLDTGEDLTLYVDVGTNGEIALGSKDGYLCCATAAGPAFEGAEISCGMAAEDGAVDSVHISDGELVIHTVSNAAPRGICGSGLIDAVAALLALGLISKNGRFISEASAPERFKSRFTLSDDGSRGFLLSENVCLSAHDIRKVQLAKAAIRAGMESLLQLGGHSADEIDRLVIAGGFGCRINIDSAVKIGLLPSVAPEKVYQAGPAAAAGAALLLRDDFRLKLNNFSDIFSYIDLSSSKVFSQNFISFLNF